MDILTTANLYPPRIPSATNLETPEHYHGGIAIDSIEKGVLKIVVDAWLNMALDDKCELYWDDDDNPVDFTVIDDLSTQKVEFYVPVGFITNGSAKVFYRVTRFPQEPVKSTELLMWVKLTRPADVDDDGEPGHSGLSYTLVPDPSNGVDSEMAKGGIRMYIDHYRYIATYDQIIGKWGDQVVFFYPVTQQQIDDPHNNRIFVTFTEDVIRKQGSGRDIPVSFRVVDRVGNLTDPKDPWARLTEVHVDLSISRLPAPTIWVNNQNVTTIDLKVLGTSDAAARVYFTAPDYQPGDKVVLTWAGTTSAGAPVIVGPLEKTIDSVPGHHDFPIPNGKIAAIANGSAKIDYQLLSANVPARPSNNVVVTVTGEVSQLKPPTVVEAPDYKLDPNRHQNGFTVVFDTAAFGANHEVNLEIAGRPGAGSVPPQQKPVAGQSKVQFDIDFSVTGANLQRSVELIYSLIVNGQPTPVQSVTLMIGELLQSSMPITKLEFFLDDLTTFENYNWNRWAQSSDNMLSNIVFASSEYFLETRLISGTTHGIYLSKCFQGIQTGTQLEFSFDFRTAAPTRCFLAHNNTRENFDLPASGSWQPMIVRFRSEASSTPNTLMLILYGNTSQILSLKNLRLKTYD